MANTAFDIKTEATRSLYAGVGVADRAVEVVRNYVAELQKAQKTVSDIDYSPSALREQAVARVSELQADATKQAADTYADLAKRGETLVGRIRRQESTKSTTATAKTTVAKAKTTRTQANKAASSTTTATKKAAKNTTKTATTTAKKQTSTATGSAKATATAAKKTAANAAQATGDAAAKVGD